MLKIAAERRPWREPAAVLAAYAHEPHALALIGGGAEARWSYVLRQPRAVLRLQTGDAIDPFAALAALLPSGERLADGPPFQGGVAGLLGYELGARVESVNLPTDVAWPDVAAALYDGLLAFDRDAGEVWTLGRGASEFDAKARAAEVGAWLGGPVPLARSGRLAQALAPDAPPAVYEGAVADVVRRIGSGEIFQANIAQGWSGRLSPGARPFDLFARLLARSPAPLAAYLRLPGAAVVSNSPERFLSVRDGVVVSRPIKGTRRRGGSPAEDARLAAELLASEKDRAENLMIVDLMRNDLARVCRPGSVEVSGLFEVETFSNVHHLVSTVTGALAEGAGFADLLRAAFPPGSVTGAPKVQAMRVIADEEGTPRGPYCGSIFWAGSDGAFDSSVLIRTAALVEDADGWRVSAKAGAGITSGSDPVQERLETEAKIDALRRALTEAPP
jgi:para-aminobenzoate synthetase component 1